MKKLMFVTFFVFSLQLFGQNNTSDTLIVVRNNSFDNGNFSINLDESVAELLLGREKCTRPKPPDRSLMVMGNKIQIFYSKDRSAAERIRDEFMKKFPGVSAEMTYASPDYKVLVGDYLNRDSAGKELRTIKREYPGAFIVEWRVQQRKAK